MLTPSLAGAFPILPFPGIAAASTLSLCYNSQDGTKEPGCTDYCTLGETVNAHGLKEFVFTNSTDACLFGGWGCTAVNDVCWRDECCNNDCTAAGGCTGGYTYTAQPALGSHIWSASCFKAGYAAGQGSQQTYNVVQCTSDPDCAGLTCSSQIDPSTGQSYGPRKKTCDLTGAHGLGTQYTCQCDPCRVGYSSEDCANSCCDADIKGLQRGDCTPANTVSTYNYAKWLCA